MGHRSLLKVLPLYTLEKPMYNVAKSAAPDQSVSSNFIRLYNVRIFSTHLKTST